MKIKLVDIFRICTSTAFLSALFAGAVSCAEEPLAMPDEGKAWAVAVEAETCASTRVSLDGLKMTWDKEDKLAFQVSTENNEYAAAELSIYDVDAGLSRAKFKGEVTLAATPVECAFAYPVAAASYSAGQLLFDYGAQDGSHSPYLYGYSLYNEAGMEVAMHHVGSMLRITNSIGNLSEITVKSNNGEKLSAILCNAETGTVSLSEAATDNFTVTPVSTTFGSEIYIAVPPVNLSKGFTLICKTTSGIKTYKSFSSDGQSSSGYDFSSHRGNIYNISLSSSPVDLDVTTSVQHTFDSEYLTGTAVYLTLGRSGVSDKIASWSAVMKNGNGETVRTFSSSERPQNVLMTDSENLPYLNPGTYTLSVTCSVHGDTYTSEQPITVPTPDIVDVFATTTYSVYKAVDASAANNTGHSSDAIYDIKSEIKIAPALFLHPKYSSSTINYSTTGISSGDMALAASGVHIPDSDSDFGGDVQMSRSSHTVTADLTFGGHTYSDAITVHVTGLPYEMIFTANGEFKDWQTYNIGSYWYSDYTRMNTTESYLLSPSFYIPSDYNGHITTYIPVRGYTSLALQYGDPTLYVSTSSSAVKSGNSHSVESGISTSIDSKFDTCKDELTLSSSSNRVSIYSAIKSQTGVDRCIYIKSCTIHYRD